MCCRRVGYYHELVHRIRLASSLLVRCCPPFHSIPKHGLVACYRTWNSRNCSSQDGQTFHVRNAVPTCTRARSNSFRMHVDALDSAFVIPACMYQVALSMLCMDLISVVVCSYADDETVHVCIKHVLTHARVMVTKAHKRSRDSLRLKREGNYKDKLFLNLYIHSHDPVPSLLTVTEL